MMKLIDPMPQAARTAARLAEFQSKQPPPQPPPPSVLAAMMPTLNRVGVTHYTAIARMRLAATALAARLWMAQHDSQPPATLNDLVPSAIAAIPQDPLAATDGGQFTYKLTPHPTITGVTPPGEDPIVVHLTAE